MKDDKKLDHTQEIRAHVDAVLSNLKPLPDELVTRLSILASKPLQTV